MNKLRKPRSDFTIIPNALLRDPSISFKAKGLYALLFSKPDEWVYIEDALLKECSDGRDSFRSGLKELSDAGWIRKEQVRDKQGNFLHTEVWLETEAGIPADGKTVDGFSVDGKSALTNTDNNKTDCTKTPPNPLEGEFDGFWKEYPNKVGKPQALKAYLKQKPEQSAVLEGVRSWKSSPSWTKDGGRFIPHPSTFLNRRQWEDRPMVQPSSAVADRYKDVEPAF